MHTQKSSFVKLSFATAALVPAHNLLCARDELRWVLWLRYKTVCHFRCTSSRSTELTTVVALSYTIAATAKHGFTWHDDDFFLGATSDRYATKNASRFRNFQFWIRFATANTHVEWFVRLSVEVSHRNAVACFATTERVRGDVRLDGILSEI